jgi:hypothetical protein
LWLPRSTGPGDWLPRSPATSLTFGERRITLRALHEGIDAATSGGVCGGGEMATLELELELGRERRAVPRESRGA